MVSGDVHSHVWLPKHQSASLIANEERVFGESLLDGSYEAHERHAREAERCVVLAFDAEYGGLCVPNEFVADYVNRDRARLIGFCSVDPNRSDAVRRFDDAIDQLGLRGLKLAPTYQNIHPRAPETLSLCDRAAERGLPIMWHQGATFVSKAPLEYALPRQLDWIAIRHPDLRMVVAHMGVPWYAETVVLIRKHAQVYADISTITARPSLLREVLTACGEAGVGHKVLFGTDFPVTTIDAAVGALVEVTKDETTSPAARAVAELLLSTDPIDALGL
jgi:uncharacterized protein